MPTHLETPEKPNALGEGRVADSMVAAVSMSGLTEKEVTRAKDAGCPAFRGSRVYVDELLAWWEAKGESLPTGDSEVDRITREIAAEKLRKIRFENEVQEGKYVPLGTITTSVEGLARDTLTIMRRVLEDEAPRRLVGKSEEELHALLPGIVDEIVQSVEEKLEEWAKAKS